MRNVIAVRSDYSSAELRQLAERSRDGALGTPAVGLLPRCSTAPRHTAVDCAHDLKAPADLPFPHATLQGFDAAPAKARAERRRDAC